jgi:hairy-and-enhancer-of-split protein
MVHALQHEGENITKLEKADVLELTVRHLRKLKRQQMLALDPTLELDRFHAGYTACASEVNRCLASGIDPDRSLGTRLMSHLGHQLASYKQEIPSATPPTSHLPLNVICPTSGSQLGSPQHSDTDMGYNSGRESSPSPSTASLEAPLNFAVKKEQEAVWRPF